VKPQKLPSEPEIEYGVLAAMFLRKNQQVKIFESLIADYFYLAANQIIYVKGRELYLNDQPIEIPTLWAALDEDQRSILGSATKLSSLPDNVPASVDVSYHIKILNFSYYPITTLL